MKKCLLCVVLFTIVAVNLFPASFACAEQKNENMKENKNLDMMTEAEHIIQSYASEHYGWERGEYAIQFEPAESQGKMLRFLVFHKDDEYPTSLGGGKSFLVIFATEIRQVVKEMRFQ